MELPEIWMYLACAMDIFHGNTTVSGVDIPRIGG